MFPPFSPSEFTGGLFLAKAPLKGRPAAVRSWQRKQQRPRPGRPSAGTVSPAFDAQLRGPPCDGNDNESWE